MNILKYKGQCVTCDTWLFLTLYSTDTFSHRCKVCTVIPRRFNFWHLMSTLRIQKYNLPPLQMNTECNTFTSLMPEETLLKVRRRGVARSRNRDASAGFDRLILVFLVGACQKGFILFKRPSLRAGHLSDSITITRIKKNRGEGQSYYINIH